MRRSSTGRPLAEFMARPGVWRCSFCATESQWRPGWMWLGSVLSLDEGRIEQVLCDTCAPLRDPQYPDLSDM